jgi:hypothetical protein
MQQYRTRYLLARLTQHVDMAFSGVKSPGSLEPYTSLEIEHILPDSQPQSCGKSGRLKIRLPSMTITRTGWAI